MNFIKKNQILFSVLAVAFAMSAFFIYKVINETNDMNKAAVQVEKLKQKITELNKQSPIPSRPNYEKITADAAVIVDKTKQLQQIFGKPYIEATKKFAKALGVPYEEFLESWKSNYNEEKGTPRALIFTKFFAKFDKAKQEKALDVFFNTVMESSVEPLNQANIDGCIMEALGLPRKMEPVVCKQYMLDMQDNLIAYMAKVKHKGDAPFVLGTGVKGNKVEKFTFDKFGDNAIPRPDEVPYIFKHLKLIEDLLFRLKASGVTSLDDITKVSLKGEKKSDYLVFDYTIKITGPIDSIRKFTDSLLEAYKDNRVYVIKSMVLTANEDTSCLIKEASEKSKRKSRTSRNYRSNRGRSVALMEEEQAANVKASQLGVPIIGNNNAVTAEIKFEYIIYVGDELTEI